VGDIYVYEKPNTGLREYFALQQPTYGYFPTSASNSHDWTYLGNSNQIDADKNNSDLQAFENRVKTWFKISSFDEWGSNRNTGVPGSIYKYNNPYSRKVDFFRLKTSSYWYYPTDKTSNDKWEYLGTF
jgi:hypothetical protein